MIAFTLMLLAHSLGDYYFQPQKLALLKSRSIGYVLIHALIYAITFFATWFLFPTTGYALAVAVAAASHLVIDVVKQIILNSAARQCVLSIRVERRYYMLDQALHLIIIAFCAIYADRQGGEGIAFLRQSIHSNLDTDGFTLLGAMSALLMVLKPANVFIRKALVTEKPSLEQENQLSRGAFIGMLERTLVLVFLYLGQYSAIALVFTAKSIARFKEFEDKSFAEYYLVGTLLSVITSIGIFIVVRFLGC